MTAKKIITAVLFLLVALILGALAVKHIRHEGEFSENSADEANSFETGEKVIVYYFHGR